MVALTKVQDGGLNLTGAGLPAGTVLQVLSTTSNATINTTSTSFVSSGVSQAITPSSTSNKILCIVSVPSWYLGGNESWVTIYRGSSALSGTATYGIMHQAVGSSYAPATGQILDSPNTTSATTYTVYFRTSNGDSTYISYVSYGYFTLTLMEIAG